MGIDDGLDSDQVSDGLDEFECSISSGTGLHGLQEAVEPFQDPIAETRLGPVGNHLPVAAN